MISETREFKIKFTLFDLNPVNDNRDLQAIRQILYHEFDRSGYDIKDLTIEEIKRS